MKGKTLLFLKKKKQKDFCYAGPGATLPPRSLDQRHKSLFCFFFLQKKENSYFSGIRPIALQSRRLALARRLGFVITFYKFTHLGVARHVHTD